ncbi:MAG: ATP synthase F1 subunit gamma [Bacteroidetes bacterium]|nr:ATP synthase F1 subunit gamma [Bacteroidota bacterium]MDA0950024.1 ATP synthase F1 subunit gamma [Bacteroidota bacterium]
MANLKEIRNRIASVSSTMQITSAMKMVSAAKLKKAQDAILAMRPYSEKLSELLGRLSASLGEDVGNYYAEKRPVNRVLLVVVSSNRGLCGAFNSNVIKAARIAIAASKPSSEIAVISIGRKAKDALKNNVALVADHSHLFDDLNYENATAIVEPIIDSFMAKEYDEVRLIYNSFKNAATQVVKDEMLLPLVQEISAQKGSALEDYIYEPEAEEMVNQLIPKALKVQFFKAIRDSFASEHGARMTAMHKATDNAKELRDQLKLTYNKARQAAITNEILEIVGGAEALND